MTMSQGMALVGASAPAGMEEVPLDLVGILEMDVSGLLDAELIERIKATYAIQALTGVLRAKYLREIRDRNFPVTAGKAGGPNTRKGWPQWLGQVFPGVAVKDANCEITGLDSLEAAYKALPAAKSGDSEGGPALPLEVPEINSTVLQELGRANGVGPAVAQKLLEGAAPATKRGVRAAIKAEKDAAKTPGIRRETPAIQPAPRSRPAALKMAPDHPDDPVTFNRKDYRGHQDLNDQRDFYKKELETMRKAIVTYQGAIGRIAKKLEEGIHADRHHPNRLHFYIHIWKDEEDFDFDAIWLEIEKKRDVAIIESQLAFQRSHGRFLEPGNAEVMP